MSRIARRGFLGLLAVTGLSTLLPPKLRAEAEGKTLITLHLIAYEIALAMEDHRQRHALPPLTVVSAGCTERRNVTFPDQVGVKPLDTLREAYLRPAGEALSRSLMKRGLTTIAPPPHLEYGSVESVVITSKERGIALRVVRQYQIADDHYVIRADVLGGKG